MKRILVTGGTGYIGSHTVVELQNAGYEVLIIDNLSRSRFEVLEGIEKISGKKAKFFQLDLCDEKEVLSFFKDNPADAVIHFAAFKAVGESSADPLLYYRNNLYGMVNLLNGMKSTGLNKIVFSSSCTVYGQPEMLPVTENAPMVKAESPYGNTKQICEEMISDTCKISDLQCISLRYFNPIGAHESAHIGELPIGVPSNLVPFITQTAIGKRQKLTVFGDDYNTPDGTCVRDYIHVVDLAKAHVIAIERLLNNKISESFEVFNLGTGNGNTVLEVIKTFEKVSGEKLNYQIGPRRPGDVEQVWADTKKANDILKWKTELSLEEMLSSAWKWEKNLERPEMQIKN